eukprot:217144_1
MSKKRKNPFMVQILKNLELRSRQTSKKRKRPDDIHESKHNLDAPPTKKMKFEKRKRPDDIHESKHNLDAPPTKKMKFEKRKRPDDHSRIKTQFGRATDQKDEI